MTLNNPDCLTVFEGYGIQFSYPGFWELTEERDGADVLLTVSADGACFWALRILKDCPPAADVLNSCVEAFRDEYEDAEVQESRGVLAQMPALRRELEFSCFELLNSVSLCSVRSSEMTLLAWWQATDHELSDVRPVFEQMTQSVRILPPMSG